MIACPMYQRLGRFLASQEDKYRDEMRSLLTNFLFFNLTFVEFALLSNHSLCTSEPLRPSTGLSSGFSLPMCSSPSLAILTVVMLTGVTMTTVRTVSAWLAGQVLIVLPSYIMPRTLPVFIPFAGTLAPIRI